MYYLKMAAFGTKNVHNTFREKIHWSRSQVVDINQDCFFCKEMAQLLSVSLENGSLADEIFFKSFLKKRKKNLAFIIYITYAHRYFKSCGTNKKFFFGIVYLGISMSIS